MPVLLCAEQVARAADFQIPHGDFKPAAKLRIFPDCRQALFRYLFEHLIAPVQKERICRPAGPADPAAQLVQLGKPHIVRILDNHRIDVGNIKARFDNGRRHQHVDFTVNKTIHNILEFPLLHLPVRKFHRRLRHKRRHLCRHIRNLVHAVKHVVHLPASCKLPGDGFPYHFFVVFHYIGLDWQAV